MVSINIGIILLVCLLGLIDGNLSQKDPDNYVRMKNQAENIEYKFTGSVEDFSQLHSPPLGPMSNYLGSDLCYKGVYAMYLGKNYSSVMDIWGSRDEICSNTNLRDYDSVRLFGSASSKVVHLYAGGAFVGVPISYSVADVANITLPNTNSLVVVGSGASATFYTLPNYGGASVCVSLGTDIYNRIFSTTNTFGFTNIRSFKFGCNSEKIVKPMGDL